jgi:hypothetical protein
LSLKSRTAGGPLLLLAACSQTTDGPQADADGAIGCALSGATAFTRDCWIERAGTAALPMLIVRHPDGGFRRFEVISGRQGLASADGADIVRMSQADDGLEVSIGTDRYRFPARMLGDASR